MKLEQRVKQLDVDPSIKVALHSIIKSLTPESSNQVPRDARGMHLKGSSVVTWMSHMIDWTDGTDMDERIESKKVCVVRKVCQNTEGYRKEVRKAGGDGLGG